MKTKALSDFPQYVAAFQALQHVRTLLAASDSRIEQLVSAINSQHESQFHAGYSQSLVDAHAIDDERLERRRQAAEAVVAGGAAEVPANMIEGVRAEYSRLAAERLILVAAMTLAEQRLAQVVSDISRIYASEIDADYRSLIVKLDIALQAAAAVVLAERDFREAINTTGFKIFPASLEPMPFFGLGDTDTENLGRVDIWREQALRAGYLKTTRLKSLAGQA